MSLMSAHFATSVTDPQHRILRSLHIGSDLHHTYPVGWYHHHHCHNVHSHIGQYLGYILLKHSRAQNPHQQSKNLHEPEVERLVLLGGILRCRIHMQQCCVERTETLWDTGQKYPCLVIWVIVQTWWQMFLMSWTAYQNHGPSQYRCCLLLLIWFYMWLFIPPPPQCMSVWKYRHLPSTPLPLPLRNRGLMDINYMNM